MSQTAAEPFLIGANRTLETVNESETVCYFVPVTHVRFLLVVFAGTPLAFCGIFTNALLIFLFLQQKYRASPTLYLAVLAILDVLFCASYIPLFTADAVALYYRILTLWELWHAYVMVLMTLGRIIQFASTYLLVCASFERFLLVSDNKFLHNLYSDRGRRTVIIIVVLTAIAVRLPTYWEWEIVPVPECTEQFQGLQFRGILGVNYFYTDIYSFYIMQIVQVFFPFILLLLLNLIIIYTIHKKLRSEARDTVMETPALLNGSASVKRRGSKLQLRRKRLRTATRTLVVMVFGYLLCGSLAVAVKFLEHVARVPVLESDAGVSTDFYAISTDVISLLFVANSFVRLFIYMGCDSELRRDFRRICSSKNADMQDIRVVLENDGANSK